MFPLCKEYRELSFSNYFSKCDKKFDNQTCLGCFKKLSAGSEFEASNEQKEGYCESEHVFVDFISQGEAEGGRLPRNVQSP